MTVFTLIQELARDWGITTFTPASNADNTNVRGPSAGDMDSLISGLNAALEEVWEAAPASMFQRPFGAALRAPTTVSVAVTSGSTAATITTWAAWMEGCTIRLGGDSADNEISHQNVLMRPYDGTTGTVSGTVYGDCVPFTESALTDSSDISHVIEPVRLVGRYCLTAAADRSDFYRRSGLIHFGNGPYFVSTPGTVVQWNKLIGMPSFYFVENANRTTAYTTHLRVNPMPDVAYVLEWQARIKPPVYAVTDAYSGTDYNTDVGTTIVLPFSFLILKAVARKHLSGDARFVNVAGKDEIDRQYKKAMASIGETRPMGVSPRSRNATPVFRG